MYYNLNPDLFVLSLFKSYEEAGDVFRALGIAERQSSTLHDEYFLRASLGAEPGGTPSRVEH